MQALYIITIIVLGLVLLGVAVMLYGLTVGFFQKVPYVPSRKKQAKAMITLAGLKDSDHVADLGAGHGTLLYIIEKEADVASLTGYEKAPLPLYFNWLSKPFRKGSKVKLKGKNFFKEDLTKYNILFLYLLPKTMDDLLPKLEKELPKGAKVLSNTFTFSKKKPSKTLTSKDVEGIAPVYLYEF